MGPLKEDWTVACPLEWPQEERDEKCISQPEAFWGTTNWKRLEDIKTVVDPDGIFVANGGIGYTYGDVLQRKARRVPGSWLAFRSLPLSCHWLLFGCSKILPLSTSGLPI